MLSLDKNTRNMITGWMQIRPGALTKVNNLELISGITKIAITGSAVHERWRSEVIRKVKTLDQLTAAFHSKGFNLRRLLRLIPQNVFSVEGKRYVNTAYINLLRSENPNHSTHVGAMLAVCFAALWDNFLFHA